MSIKSVSNEYPSSDVTEEEKESTRKWNISLTIAIVILILSLPQVLRLANSLSGKLLVSLGWSPDNVENTLFMHDSECGAPNYISIFLFGLLVFLIVRIVLWAM
jgi:hypothetical protein